MALLNRAARRRAGTSEAIGVPLTRTLRSPQHFHLRVHVFEKFASDKTSFFNSVAVETVGNNIGVIKALALRDFGEGIRTLTHIESARQCHEASHIDGAID